MSKHRLRRRYGRSAGKVTREQINAGMLKCGILRTKLMACEAKVTKLIEKMHRQERL
jgi:hypothetical protein